jgi:AraC family transcriptional regulator, transcriptional activator of pobA
MDRNVPDLSPVLYERSGTLGLSLHSHLDPPFSPEMIQRLSRPHRTNHYFLLFVERGAVTYSVDLEEMRVSSGEVLFVKPNQVRVPPLEKGEAHYFKITFDEACYARLPRIYRFWLDPWEVRRIALTREPRGRLQRLFDLLREAVRSADGSDELIIAYLNTIMSELERAYFAQSRSLASPRNLDAFLRFQSYVEEAFRRQPLISEAASSLGISESALYSTVKAFSGLSPKGYLNRRIALEAQRLVFYSTVSVKELADHLGFQDESYFSRFFRKQTGRSISQFLAASADLSGNSEDSSLTSPGSSRYLLPID